MISMAFEAIPIGSQPILILFLVLIVRIVYIFMAQIAEIIIQLSTDRLITNGRRIVGTYVLIVIQVTVPAVEISWHRMNVLRLIMI